MVSLVSCSLPIANADLVFYSIAGELFSDGSLGCYELLMRTWLFHPFFRQLVSSSVNYHLDLYPLTTSGSQIIVFNPTACGFLDHCTPGLLLACC